MIHIIAKPQIILNMYRFVQTTLKNQIHIKKKLQKKKKKSEFILKNS